MATTQQLLLITFSVCLMKELQCRVLPMLWDVRRCLRVQPLVCRVYACAFVFMLQWGVKLIWEPELLNLLLKLVFDRKLISKAREEEEDGRKKERRKRGECGIWVFCVSGLILLLCSGQTCFRWMNHETRMQGMIICCIGEEPSKKPFSTLHIKQLLFTLFHRRKKDVVHTDGLCFELNQSTQVYPWKSVMYAHKHTN